MVKQISSLIFLVLFVWGCTSNKCNFKELAIDEFLIMENHIYGDSLYIYQNYGTPDNIKDFRGQTTLEYNSEDISFGFRKKEANHYELGYIKFHNYKDNLLSINGHSFTKNDFDAKSVKNNIGCAALMFNVPDDNYSLVRFLSDKETMRPNFAFEGKMLVDVLF